MFLAIDRVSKFTYFEFRDNAGKMNGADFLRGVVGGFPYAIHTVLTDNGMAFADVPKNRSRSSAMVATSSTASANNMESSTSLRSHIIRGPTGRPSE